MKKAKTILKHLAIISPQLIFIYLSYSYYYGYLKLIYPNREALQLGSNNAIQNYAYLNIAISLVTITWYIMKIRVKKKANNLVLPLVTFFQILFLFLLFYHYGSQVTEFLLRTS